MVAESPLVGGPCPQEESVVASARAHFERTLVKVRGAVVGSVAAMEHPSSGDAANYGEVFLRDNVPVMFHLLLEGRFAIVRHFLAICLELQSHSDQTRGIFPTSFVAQGQELIADYGQRSIGRISSVDASLWWPVLCWLYVRGSGDNDFALQEEVQEGLQRLLDLVMHPSFEGTPVLFVPDCAFMIDRPMDVWGAPLEVEVLLFGCLRSCCHLMDLAQRDRFSNQRERRLAGTRSWLRDLRGYLLKNYWVTSKTVQVLRRRPTEQYGDDQHVNAFNVQAQVVPAWLQEWLENKGGYLIGNMRTGRPDFRFYSLGNALACLFGLITAPQQRALFRLVLHNREHLIAEMPMRISHPPLDAEEWREKTGSDPKNWTWSYHNGGHWPCLLWYLGGAVLLHERRHPGSDGALMERMRQLLEECYALQLSQLPRQRWAEYFDGPTGTWVGQQARTYQTWTIVGFLLLHHLLRIEPLDAELLAIDPLEPLTKPGSDPSNQD